MLKNILPILNLELLKVLCEIGHGNEIILVDGTFSAEGIGKDAIVIRADGHGTVELLETILIVLRDQGEDAAFDDVRREVMGKK